MSEGEKKVDDQDLQSLLDMGYEEIPARDALSKFPNNLDRAVEYLISSDEAAAAGTGTEGNKNENKVAKSYICVDTGKVFRTMRDAQLYAERTGNTNFEESEIEVPPLTAEEKKEKLEQIKAKIELRRAERAEKEKVDEIEREKNRRKEGKEMLELREEMKVAERQREAERLKREKEEENRERERIRENIAKDKGERAAKNAKTEAEAKALYKAAYDKYMDKFKKKEVSVEERVSKIIEAILEVGKHQIGEKVNKQKILLETAKKMFENIVENKTEEKFRKIRLSNKTFQNKIGQFQAGMLLFQTVGFENQDVDGEAYLVLADGFDEKLLGFAIDKITESLQYF